MAREKRLRNFILSRELVLELVRRAVVEQIPQDAEVVSVSVIWENNSIGIIVEHPTYDPVAEGAVIPRGGLLGRG